MVLYHVFVLVHENYLFVFVTIDAVPFVRSFNVCGVQDISNHLMYNVSPVKCTNKLYITAFIKWFFNWGCKKDQLTSRNPQPIYIPNSSEISCIAVKAISAKSWMVIPISSHSRIVSRFTEAAKAFSFIRLVIDLVFTEASFLSG